MLPHVLLGGEGPLLIADAVQLPKALPVALVGELPVALGLAVDDHVFRPQVSRRGHVPPVKSKASRVRRG